MLKWNPLWKALTKSVKNPFTKGSASVILVMEVQAIVTI